MNAMYGIERTRSVEGPYIQPRWGWDRGGATTQGGAALALGFGIEPRWGSGAKAFLKSDGLHNKRLHADATALSINLLAVASRLRWPSEVHRAGAGEPQSVIRPRS